jgi:acyl carrier protein
MTDHPDNSQIEESIREFVARNLLYSETGYPYNDDTSFLSEGIIDSLGVMELVAFAQKTFGVSVDQQDVTTDNFDSVAKLAAFVRRKRAEAVPCQAAGQLP